MARTVTVKAGKQSVQVFAANLLQHTCARFLKPLLQTPDVHGRATIPLQESIVPALVKAFQILSREETPHTVSVPEYLKLMLTLSSCNDWIALEALTSSLVPEGRVSDTWKQTGEFSVQALRSSLEIMTLFLPQLKTSPGDNICFAAKSLPVNS